MMTVLYTIWFAIGAITAVILLALVAHFFVVLRGPRGLLTPRALRRPFFNGDFYNT